jgi:hypothetical protein
MSKLAGKVLSAAAPLRCATLGADSARALALGKSTGSGFTTASVCGIQRVRRGPRPAQSAASSRDPGPGCTARHLSRAALAATCDLIKGSKPQKITSFSATQLFAWVLAIALLPAKCGQCWQQEHFPQLQPQ